MHDTLHYNTQKEIFHRIIEQRKEQIKLSCFTILDLWWSRRVRHNFKSLNKILVSYANHLLYYSCKRISLMELFWKEKNIIFLCRTGMYAYAQLWVNCLLIFSHFLFLGYIIIPVRQKFLERKIFFAWVAFCLAVLNFPSYFSFLSFYWCKSACCTQQAQPIDYRLCWTFFAVKPFA